MSLQKGLKKKAKKEPEDYKRFIFIEPDTVPVAPANHESSTPESSVTKLQEVQTELHSDITEQVSTEQVSTESEESEPISTEPEQPEPEVEMQEDDNANHSRGKEPVLAKYVRRHHSADQIIGDKSDGTMTRSKLKGTCLLANFEPRSVKDALGNDSWIEAMNEEIE